MKIVRSFLVRPEPHVAHAYLQDFSRAAEWDPGTQRCERLDAGPIALGSRWHNESSFLGRSVTLTYTLIRADTDRLVFEGANDAATSVDDIQLTQAEPSGTRVTYRATITLTGPLRVVLDPLMKLLMRRVADKTVDQMTAVLNGLS